jgi:hypothetical protein
VNVLEGLWHKGEVLVHISENLVLTVGMGKEVFEDTKEEINIRKSKWPKDKGQTFCYNN